MPVLNPVRSRSGFAALLAALTLVGIVLLGVTGAGADQMGIEDNGPSGDYAFGSSDCEGLKSDPVGVLFRGRRAGPSNVSDYITDEAKWHWTENDGAQGLLVHQPDGSYKCRATDASNAQHTNRLPNSRFHVRLWYVPGSAGGGEVKTVGTPHHEDWVFHDPTGLSDHCLGVISLFGEGVGNHAVDKGGIHQNLESGFDWGRHELKHAFEAHHAVESEYWGNTAEFEQCDEDMAGSDGWGTIIWINRGLHPRTQKASYVRSTTARLNGDLITEEPATEYWFGYGPKSSQGVSGYPYKTAVKATSGPGEINVSEPVSGLAQNATYYARMFARNQDGEVEEGEEVQYSTCGSVSSDEDDDSAGPRAASQCSGVVDVFYRDTNGNLGHQWWTPSSGWATETRPAAIAPGSVPRVVTQSNGSGVVDVFYRDTNGNLGHQWWTPSNGWETETRPAAMASDPHVTAQSDGVVDVFYRDTNGNLGHQWWTPSNGWETETRPAAMASDPHVTAQSDGVVDVFYRDTNGNLGHQWWTPTSGWATETRPASMSSDPHVVASPSGSGVVDVFYRDTNGNLGHQWWTPTSGWATETRPASIAPSSVPRVIAQPSGVVDVFYRDTNGNLGHQWWTPGSGWATETRPASMASDPHVTAQFSGVVDVFYRDTNGNLGHQWWTPTSGWATETRSASMSSDPHVVASPSGSGVVDVFYRDTNGNLGHQWWTPTSGWATETRPAAIVARPPVVSTGGSSGISTSTATVSGTADPENSPTTYYFEYGTSTTYGSKMPGTGAGLGYGGSSTPVSQSLNGLSEGTTYHYRLVATSPEGTTAGEDKTFETTAVGPEAAALGAMPTTDPFNGAATSISNFAGSWTALPWATGTSPKGEDRFGGWGPVDAFSNINGAIYGPVVTDLGSGNAVAATMTGSPQIAERYFALWLDVPGSSGTRNGYQLKFYDAATNKYTVSLVKWSSGTATVLAETTNYGFVNGNSLALIDKGSTVSAWVNTGAGFAQLLSASDSTYSSGTAAVEGSGNYTRLTNLRFGSLQAKVADMNTALKTLPVNDPFSVSENPLSYGGAFSALTWDNSTTGHNTGRVSGGWGPYDAYSAINGAYWQKTSFADTGAGTAVAATVASGPGNNFPGRYFSLWLDMANPSSARSGYQLRFVETSLNVYEVILAKWTSGTETVLASKAGYSFAAKSQFALVDKGGTVSAWTNTSSEYRQILSVGDATYTSGYTGIEGSGNESRLIEFRSGSLAPF